MTFLLYLASTPSDAGELPMNPLASCLLSQALRPVLETLESGVLVLDVYFEIGLAY